MSRHPPSRVPGDDRARGSRWVRGASCSRRRSRRQAADLVRRARACPILAPFIKEGLGLSAFALGVLVGALNVGRFAGSVPARAARGPARRADRPHRQRPGPVRASPSSPRPPSYLPILVALVFAGVFSGAATPAGSRVVLAAFPRESRRAADGRSARPRSRSAGSPPPSRCRCSHRRGAGAGRWRPPRSSRCSARRSSRSRGCRPPSAATRAGARTWRSSPGRRKIVYAGIWALVFVGGQYALLTYLALYLEDDLGVGRTEAFATVALANLRARGSPRVGLAERPRVRQPAAARAVVLSLLGILSTALLAGAPSHEAMPVVVVGAALGGFCLIGWQGLWVTMVSELAPGGQLGDRGRVRPALHERGHRPLAAAPRAHGRRHGQLPLVLGAARHGARRRPVAAAADPLRRGCPTSARGLARDPAGAVRPAQVPVGRRLVGVPPRAAAAPSSNGRPISCIATGMPSTKPMGTDSAGVRDSTHTPV